MCTVVGMADFWLRFTLAKVPNYLDLPLPPCSGVVTVDVDLSMTWRHNLWHNKGGTHTKCNPRIIGVIPRNKQWGASNVQWTWSTSYSYQVTNG